MIKSKAACKQRLGIFNELRRESKRKVAEIRRPYESAYTEIQLEVFQCQVMGQIMGFLLTCRVGQEAKIDSTKSSIDAFTDIRVMAASAVASMRGAMGPDALA
jgi:hypothetical protein